MNTLEERLERDGYTARINANERDKRLVENAKRECEFSGTELPPHMREFEEAVRNEEASLAAEYESTVRLVDSRNDLEFALLEMQEKIDWPPKTARKPIPKEPRRSALCSAILARG